MYQVVSPPVTPTAPPVFDIRDWAAANYIWLLPILAALVGPLSAAIVNIWYQEHKEARRRRGK